MTPAQTKTHCEDTAIVLSADWMRGAELFFSDLGWFVKSFVRGGSEAATGHVPSEGVPQVRRPEPLATVP